MNVENPARPVGGNNALTANCFPDVEPLCDLLAFRDQPVGDEHRRCAAAESLRDDARNSFVETVKSESFFSRHEKRFNQARCSLEGSTDAAHGNLQGSTDDFNCNVIEDASDAQRVLTEPTVAARIGSSACLKASYNCINVRGGSTSSIIRKHSEACLDDLPRCWYVSSRCDNRQSSNHIASHFADPHPHPYVNTAYSAHGTRELVDEATGDHASKPGAGGTRAKPGQDSFDPCRIKHDSTCNINPIQEISRL